MCPGCKRSPWGTGGRRRCRLQVPSSSHVPGVELLARVGVAGLQAGGDEGAASHHSLDVAGIAGVLTGRGAANAVDAESSVAIRITAAACAQHLAPRRRRQTRNPAGPVAFAVAAGAI